MLHDFPFYLGLIVFIMLLVMLAERIRVAYPIVLVLGGLLISLVPSVPKVEVDEELIFLIFLPPLLYEAAWYTSWKEFWRWRRIIGSFAFIVVIITAFAVAWVASSFIPGFTLALGFLLGGIVSPPDAVSATAILKNLKVPKRLSAILEGESLLNDASSLVVFRFALIAVSTGRFVFMDAAGDFVWVIVAGVAVGLIVAYLFYIAHRKLPTNVNMDIVLTLVAPYAMYIAAESFHVSGVLAVVSGGLFLSAKQHLIMDHSSRLRAQSVWSALGFVLNGLVFMLIGLELPIVVNDLDGVGLSGAIGYGCLITVVLILVRMACAFGALWFTMFISRYITTADPRPGYKAPTVLGWAGMRGVVSLAAALSIPMTLENGQPFPQRSVIIFITFVVILLTLVVQGLTLPMVINMLKLEDPDNHLPEHEENKLLHKRLAKESLLYLQTHFAKELAEHPALKHLADRWEDNEWLYENEVAHNGYKKTYKHLLNEQRKWLHEWNKEIRADEDVIRQHLMRIDLEEEKLKYS